MSAGFSATYWVYFAVIAVALAVYIQRRSERDRRNRALAQQSLEQGLTEPPSLHPVVNSSLCIGCNACELACPEQGVLGVIGGKVRLVNPSGCIGHGACAEACPVDAITLVFGTATRGMDIPLLTPDFETTVPGVYIAGELGGMGLIRNAMEQGKQAVNVIASRFSADAATRSKAAAGQGLDLLIVGAGPAGLAASLAARDRGLRFVTLEQDSLGGTVFHYPRGKLVMTAPVDLPLVGRVRFTETSKEELLEFWRRVEREHDLGIRYGEKMTSVKRDGELLNITTESGVYRASAVLLAIGRRGTPRRLGVSGEDSPRVVYGLVDPAQYAGAVVLVVGGGDSALEAACSIAEQPGATVSLSYRGEAFSRAKPRNRQAVEDGQRSGRLRVLLGSTVLRVNSDSVELEHRGETVILENEAVIVCAGGVLPTASLKSMGVEVETRYGNA